MDRGNEIQVRAEVYDTVRRAYDKAVGKDLPTFDQIPARARTAILSLAFHYGPYFRVTRRPLWDAIVAQDWEAAGRAVLDLTDKHVERRGREAGLFSNARRHGPPF